MFKTSVRLMKLCTEVETQITLAILAKDVYEDLEPGRPNDRFAELNYDDWILMVIHELGWEFGEEYIICRDGHMYIKPDNVDLVVAVAPSFMAEAYVNHLTVLRNTLLSGYNLAQLEQTVPGEDEDYPPIDR